MSLSKKYEDILDKLAVALLRKVHPPAVHVLIRQVASRRGFFHAAIVDYQTGQVLEQGIITVYELLSFVRQLSYANKPPLLAWAEKLQAAVHTFLDTEIHKSVRPFVDQLQQLTHTHYARGLGGVITRTEGINQLERSMAINSVRGVGVTFIGGGGSGGGSR